MKSIGFDNTGIGLMIAVYSVVMLAVETPSGILADRWSRKGVLILASIFLGLSGLIGGLSYGIGSYLAAAILWGIYFACYSGIYDSIIYDTIAETNEDSKLFDTLYGHVQLVESIALVIAGLAGSFLARTISLRATYFLTIPFILLPVIFLLKFREPTLHKRQVAQPVMQQVSATFRASLKNPPVLPVVVVLILQVTLIYTLYEFSQLWLLALHTPTQYYGVAYALLLSSYGAGGILVARLRLSRFWAALGMLLVTLLGFVGLIIFRNTPAIIVSQFVAGFGLVSIGIIFRRLLHDGLSPKVRAGAAAATSTIGRFLIVPFALIFGYVSNQFGIYKAAYAMLGLATVMVFFVIVVANHSNRTGLESNYQGVK